MAEQYQDFRTERSIGSLFGEITNGLSTLVRQEIDLARTELTLKATSMGKDVGMVAAGGFVAYAGFLAVVAALVLLLGHVIPLWVAALVVGLAVIGGGYLLVRTGLQAMKTVGVAPTNTVETMQENARWAKEQVT